MSFGLFKLRVRLPSGGTEELKGDTSERGKRGAVCRLGSPVLFPLSVASHTLVLIVRSQFMCTLLLVREVGEIQARLVLLRTPVEEKKGGFLIRVLGSSWDLAS